MNSPSKSGKNIIRDFTVIIELPDTIPSPILLDKESRSKSQSSFFVDEGLSLDDDSDDLFFAHNTSPKAKHKSRTKLSQNSVNSDKASTPTRKRRGNPSTGTKKKPKFTNLSCPNSIDSDDEIKKIETTYSMPDMKDYEDSDKEENFEININKENWQSEQKPMSVSMPLRPPPAISPPRGNYGENPRLMKARLKASKIDASNSGASASPVPSPPSSPVQRVRPYIRRGAPHPDHAMKIDSPTVTQSDNTISEGSIFTDDQNSSGAVEEQKNSSQPTPENSVQPKQTDFNSKKNYTISYEVKKNKLGASRKYCKIFENSEALFSIKTKNSIDNTTIEIQKGSDPHISGGGSHGIIIVANDEKDFSLRETSEYSPELLTFRYVEKDRYRLYLHEFENRPTLNLKATIRLNELQTIDFTEENYGLFIKLTFLNPTTISVQCSPSIDPKRLLTIAFALFVNK